MQVEPKTKMGNDADGGACLNSHSSIEGRKRPPIADRIASYEFSDCSDASPTSTKRRRKNNEDESTVSENDDASETEEQAEEQDDDAGAVGVSSRLSHSSKWDVMFKKLLRFKEIEGHCLVPNRYKEDTKLGSWVSTQRRQYKALEGGTTSKTVLPQSRIDRLESAGFVWETSDPRRVEWEFRYKQLCDFRREYGTALVPMLYEPNTSLANWVSVQRQEYKNLLKRRPSKMTSERIRLLELVDFVWKAPRGARRKNLDSVLAHPNKPTNSKQGDHVAAGSVAQTAVLRATQKREQVEGIAGATSPKGKTPQPCQPSSSDSVQFPLVIDCVGKKQRARGPEITGIAVRPNLIPTISHPYQLTTIDAGAKATESLGLWDQMEKSLRKPNRIGLPLGLYRGGQQTAMLPDPLGQMAGPNLAELTMAGTSFSPMSPFQHLLAPAAASIHAAVEAQLYQQIVAQCAFPTPRHLSYPLVGSMSRRINASLGAGLLSAPDSLAQASDDLNYPLMVDSMSRINASLGPELLPTSDSLTEAGDERRRVADILLAQQRLLRSEENHESPDSQRSS